MNLEVNNNKTCNLCNKIFKSVQGLIRHKNRKMPCNIEDNFTCEFCSKSFTRKQNFEQHLKRKTSCTRSIDNNLALIKFETECKLEIIRAEKEKELAIIEAKKASNIELEKIKTERKTKTATIVNYNNQQIINDIRIQQINNYIVQLPSEGVISATLENCDVILKTILKDLLISEELEELYNQDLANIPIEIISKTYANDHYPQHKNIWYNKDLNAFYCVIDEQWNPMDKEILMQIIRRTFEKYIKMFSKYLLLDKITESHLAKFPFHKKDNIEIETIAQKALNY